MQFVDTNVLLYAVSTARGEGRKTSRARELLDDVDLGLSVQVLQEFYVQATRPTRSGRLSHRQAASLVESWLRFTVAETTIEILQAALATADRHKLSYWDAAIIESARVLGCRTVLSEDLAHGRNFDGVTVLNPFRD